MFQRLYFTPTLTHWCWPWPRYTEVWTGPKKLWLWLRYSCCYLMTFSRSTGIDLPLCTYSFDLWTITKLIAVTVTRLHEQQKLCCFYFYLRTETIILPFTFTKGTDIGLFALRLMYIESLILYHWHYPNWRLVLPHCNDLDLLWDRQNINGFDFSNHPLSRFDDCLLCST